MRAFINRAWGPLISLFRRWSGRGDRGPRYGVRVVRVGLPWGWDGCSYEPAILPDRDLVEWEVTLRVER